MEKIRTVKQGDLTFWYGIEQGTQEWLDFRKNYATCSNAGLLCDKGIKSAFECNRQHAARKTPNATEHTERGHELEAEVKEILGRYFNNDTQALIDDCSFITNSKYPRGGYSPDGIIIDLETQEFVAPVEVKCFNDWTWRDNGKGGKVKHYSWKHKECCEDIKNVPYEIQMQFEMEMLMTDTNQLVVVFYNPDAEGDVPIIKIHTYSPFLVNQKQENGLVTPVPIFRNRLAEQLSGEPNKKGSATDEALERWKEKELRNAIEFGW